MSISIAEGEKNTLAQDVHIGSKCMSISIAEGEQSTLAQDVHIGSTCMSISIAEGERGVSIRDSSQIPHPLFETPHQKLDCACRTEGSKIHQQGAP